jgi:immunoglobulin I-set domain
LYFLEAQGKSSRPRIAHKARVITAKSPQSVIMLPCSAQGFPKVTIEWYKQSSSAGPLIPLKKWSQTIRQLQDGTLVIGDDVTEEGEYVCVASNNEGEEKHTTRLEVIGK